MVNKPYLKIFMNISVLIPSTFFFFFGAEVLCRNLNLTEKFDADFKFYIRNVDTDVKTEYNVEDFLLMWRPKENYVKGSIEINSEGFRDKEYKKQKYHGVFRILCLGDSTTFGFGVKLSETYHGLLENKLNGELGSQQRKFEVINAGVTGYTSAQGLALYKYKGIEYHPDIVTFYFGINDPIKRFYMNDNRIMQTRLPLFLRLFMNNYLIRLDSYRLLRKIILTPWRNKEKGTKENIARVSLSDFKSNILELNRLCQSHGATLVLISPPFCPDARLGSVWFESMCPEEKAEFLERMKDIALYRKTLEDVASQCRIPLIQIQEMSDQSGSGAGDYFQDSVHPSKLGHERIMLPIYSYLMKKLGYKKAERQR